MATQQSNSGAAVHLWLQQPTYGCSSPPLAAAVYLCLQQSTSSCSSPHLAAAVHLWGPLGTHGAGEEPISILSRAKK